MVLVERLEIAEELQLMWGEEGCTQPHLLPSLNLSLDGIIGICFESIQVNQFTQAGFQSIFYAVEDLGSGCFLMLSSTGFICPVDSS